MDRIVNGIMSLPNHPHASARFPTVSFDNENKSTPTRAGNSKPCRISASTAELMMQAGSVRARAVRRIVASTSVRASGPHEITLRRMRMARRCRYSVLSEKTKFVPVSKPMRRATCSMAVSGTSAVGRNRPMVWKIFKPTSKATWETGNHAMVGAHCRSSKLGPKSCCRSPGVSGLGSSG